MFEEDDGFFHYDSTCPPLFLQNSKQDDQQTIQQAVIQYLRSSAQSGIKHPNAVMSSGLTPGEAALIHFRECSHKQNDSQMLCLIDLLRESIRSHLGFDPYDHQELFHKHLQIVGLNELNVEHKVTCGLKNFLKECNKKTKGYTYDLKHIIQDIKDAREKKRFSFQ